MMMTVRRKMCCLRQGKCLDTAGHHSRINKKTTLFYLSNEGISIFENVCKIGLPLRGQLKNLLEKFKDIKNQAE